MTAIMRMLRELAGLFVDDGWFAIAILAVIALAKAVSLVPDGMLAAGAVLLFGCLAVLFVNVARSAQR